MATATIVYEIDIETGNGEGGPVIETVPANTVMVGWPPDSYLVQIDPPLKRFNPATGEPAGEYSHIAVQIPRAEMAENDALVYPSTPKGEFVDSTMSPIRTVAGGVLHSVLKGLGYEVTN